VVNWGFEAQDWCRRSAINTYGIALAVEDVVLPFGEGRMMLKVKLSLQSQRRSPAPLIEYAKCDVRGRITVRGAREK